MATERPKRASRLAWFGFEPDAFEEDSRMRPFSNKERSFWGRMLQLSFRHGGFMSTDPAVIASQTGATVKEAHVMVSKLLDENLLIPTGKLYEAYSPRMVKEYAIAKEASERMSTIGKNGGKKSAELRLVKAEP